MNIFGRSRSPSQTPPPPPKRPESWEHVGPPVEELEDGDTYEVPPCEGQVLKVAPAKRQEDMDGTYLDQACARRCSEPLLLSPAKEGPPEEEIYLECELSQAPCRLPPLQPPKLPKPKTTLPGSRHGLVDTSSDTTSPVLALPGGSGSSVEDPDMQDQAWYAGRCDRHTAETILHGVNKDSAFMVRQSSKQGWKQPFTLAVLYQGRVYNIPIRYLESSRQYTLGKEGKSREELFDSVASIVQHYSQQPLVLIDSSSSARAYTCLLFPVKP